MKHVYFTPWCRIGAFIVGTLTGYAIFKSRSNPKFKLSHVRKPLPEISQLLYLIHIL